MHEFSLIDNLLEIVKERVNEKAGRRVTKIFLKVGTFSGAVPELLDSAFQFLKKNTIAEDAELFIELEKARVKCRRCQQVYESEDMDLICPYCGVWGGEVLSGEGILLERIEFEL